jgi:hypothetical protein
MKQVRKPHEVRAAYWRYVADWDRFGNETDEAEVRKYERQLDKFGRELSKAIKTDAA